VRAVLAEIRNPVACAGCGRELVHQSGSEDAGRDFGARFVRAPVGEAKCSRDRDEGAVIGGEGNGGVILPLYTSGVSPLGVALILHIWPG